jgi:ATPase subunit of ABC transporter with duplicated ATPase domains
MPSEPVVALRDVTIAHPNAAAPLLVDLSVTFPRGFTGILGANGAGKTSLLRVLAGELAPVTGRVEVPFECVFCEQRTDAPPDRLGNWLDDWRAEALDLQRRLGIEPDFLARWDTLSHGERKRAQIGCALWQEPALLAIDEPTNHVDAGARDVLIDALRRFTGVGLIVSHDRELLDELCSQSLWLDPPRALLVPGGYTRAREQRALNRESAIRAREDAVRERARIDHALAQRRAEASRADHKRSKRGLARKDHDAKGRRDAAIVSGKDGQAGRLTRQLEGRLRHSEARVASARVEKSHPTGIWVPGSRSRRDILLTLEGGRLPLGGGRRLHFPDLTLAADARIGLTGANGAGKSTLLRHLLAHCRIPGERIVYLPQEVDAAAARSILDAAGALPHGRLGEVLNIVSRLGSRPERLLESRMPSPGELRKLLLALGIVRAPELIVLDEPTNHLDLPSIEALEAALEQCPSSLLLTTHDPRLLERLTRSRWHIEIDRGGDSMLTRD